MSRRRTDIDSLSAGALSDVLSLVAEDATPNPILEAALAGEEEIERRAGGVLGTFELGSLMAALRTDRPRTTELADWKNSLKGAFSEAPDDASRGAVMVLYHVAIARGYAYNGHWISSHDKRDAIALYDDLSRVLVNSPLGRILREAVDRADHESS